MLSSDVLLGRSPASIDVVISKASSRNEAPSSFKWGIISSIPIFVFAFVVLAITNGGLDRESYWRSQEVWFLWLNSGLTKIPSQAWVSLTQLGDAIVLLPLLMLVTIRLRQVWLVVIFAIPFAGISSILLKSVFSVPRPAAVISQHFNIYGETLTGLNSLPSGHAITVFVVFAAVVSTLIPKPETPRHYALIAGVLGFASILALSRVAVGAHWPMDIVLGSGIGMVASLVGTSVVRYIGPEPSFAPFARKGGFALLIVLIGALLSRVVTDVESNLIVLIALLSGVLALIHLVLEDRLTICLVVSKARCVH